MPKAKFDAIYRELRGDIQGGNPGFGEAFPTEMELVARFGCSRNTIRRAIGMLVADGYVQSVQGSGVTVIYLPSDRDFVPEGSETFTEIAQRTGSQARTRCLMVEAVVVDEALAKESGFVEGTRAWHIEVVRCLGGRALIRAEGLLRRDLVPDLDPTVFEQGSLYDYLERKVGLQVITNKQLITAEEASARDLELLELDGLTFVASVATRSFDADGNLFEYQVSHHHPGHFAFPSVSSRRR